MFMEPKLWMERLSTLKGQLIKKGADHVKFNFEPPISQSELLEIEKRNNFQFPNHFAEVVTQVARSCEFSWSMHAKYLPKGYYEQGLGGAPDFIWNVDLVNDIGGYGIADYYNEDFVYDLINVGNGDIIAFDTINGLDQSKVIYIDCREGEPEPEHSKNRVLNGRRLGNNFIDFMNRWISLGCPNHNFAMEEFYDFEQNILMNEGEVVENWIKWLES